MLACGTQAIHDNPYDGHTLGKALDQLRRLVIKSPEHVLVDRGYKAHGYDGDIQVHVDKQRRGRTGRSLWI